ncbi:FAS1 domain-containing protein [Glomus cerebriforme]|uniref:FAS1 domain-containing protein n=1 Tax=Glomus cerebriforme TaxID=658196 RepID=A0A397SP57_9GLOM|nr:FAS1 domain-containing protein [Glomus cerebriforme]
MLNIRIILFFTFILSLLSNLSVAKKTITDVLYSQKRFSKLVTALQRTRLLHEINRLETATLFAPSNEAFDDDPLMTRERMLYHFLFGEFKKEELHDGQLLDTRLDMDEKLGTIGQKVKVEVADNEIYVGNGRVTDTNLEADNGIIHVITEVLDTPVDLYTTLTSMDQLQVFSEYLRKKELDDHLSNGNHITIFAPTNDAIKSQLSFHEREYLMGECGGGLDDLELWVKNHLHNDTVLYSEAFKLGITKVPTIREEYIKVEKDEQGNMRVADGDVTFRDLLAENGVVHVITSAATPHSLKFTTHKYLCGLKATKFVASIIKHELQHYIENTKNSSYTILAPRDDHLDESLTLRYHIIKGKYLPSDLTDEMLIKTEFTTEELRNNSQRATVNLIQKWDKDKEDIQRTEIQFNGISVIGDPIEIGNDIIYILSNTMTPPQSVIKILHENRQLSSMSTYIMITGMIQKVRSAKGITIIAPSTEAFTQLGLINQYLIHQDAKDELISVLLHHIINETIYSEDISEDGTTYYTIGGDPIKIYKMNDNIFVSNANDTSKVSRKDVLTSTGVLHVLDKVITPPTLHITLGKLLKGINAQTFLDIVEAANLTELVQDPLEPFTILAPTEGAFKKINVTKLLADPELASRWARLHMIPSTIDELTDNYEVPTLLSNDANLIIKKDLRGNYNIEVKGYWSFKEKATLLSSGKTWNGGAVYEIDKVLLPEHVTQHIGSTFADITIGSVLFGFIVMSGVYCWHFWNIWKRQSYQEIRNENE